MTMPCTQVGTGRQGRLGPAKWVAAVDSPAGPCALATLLCNPAMRALVAWVGSSGSACSDGGQNLRRLSKGPSNRFAAEDQPESKAWETHPHAVVLVHHHQVPQAHGGKQDVGSLQRERLGDSHGCRGRKAGARQQV